MGIFDVLGDVVGALTKASTPSGGSSPFSSNLIDYGQDKIGGGHDHRTNKGDDRTPAQKEGDKKRTKKD